ncbi:BON domain-containing protein (plasmid) [Phyllobacterium sp. A18/5-2]|uniref:BON domain-containing protein n=1 Tax=Phyllobacterium sp. A18/5-2 TaxID=2978392 RepID=UPI0021C7F90C|nr:BON domain-containing protein [Phyllobacterium sp. A18/5-2]UXN66225.1 BON domain-containing protein [Phyllobacterium sp. A18/5-2]
MIGSANHRGKLFKAGICSTYAGQSPLQWNYQKNAAAEAVRGLSGVIDVYNKIEVNPRSTAWDIKKRIEDALKRAAEVEAKSMTVDVDGFRKVNSRGV